jgi:hypothetical protein
VGYRYERTAALMKDLSSPLAIKVKGILLLLVGLLAVTLLLVDSPSWKTAGLLALAIWSFCRCYYFALYVLEKYVDPSYRFAGLTSLVRHLVGRRNR